MKVFATNIAEIRIITIGDEKMETGIFKHPVNEIFLKKNDVQNDVVSDRKYHGGPDMACYLFGRNNYPFFQDLYPNADWELGMFGENITLDNLDESTMNIGDIFQIGEATIQIAQPRIPCSKLGYRLGSPHAVKTFAEANFPGVYVRVIKPGNVKSGDEMIRIKEQNEKLSIVELYRVLIHKSANQDKFIQIISNPFVPEGCKSKLKE